LVFRDPAFAEAAEDEGVAPIGTLPSMGASTGRSVSGSKTGRDAASIVSSLVNASSKRHCRTVRTTPSRSSPGKQIQARRRLPGRVAEKSVSIDVGAYLNSDGPGEPRDGSQIRPLPSEDVTWVTFIWGRNKFKREEGRTERAYRSPGAQALFWGSMNAAGG